MSDSHKKIIVNGREYNSLNEVPPELRDILADKNANGIPDIVESGGRGGVPVIRQTSYNFNGKEYSSLEAMPPDVRRVFESMPKSEGLGPRVQFGIGGATREAPARQAAPNPGGVSLGGMIAWTLLAAGVGAFVMWVMMK